MSVTTWAAAVCGAGVLAASAAAPTPVRADHPLIVEGRRAVERARFQQALETFERAAEGDDLDRSDVLALLEGRVLAYAATDQDDLLDETLTALASLDRQRELPPELPPNVQERFRRAVERVEGVVEVDANVAEGEGWIEAEPVIANDPAGLVREVQVYVRKGERRWAPSSDRRFMLTRQQGPVELFVEAIGIGGAVLARDGSRRRPLRFEAVMGLEPAATDPARETESSSSPSKLWLWGGAAAALLIAGSLTVGLVLARRDGGSQRTKPGTPTVLDF